ncbi:MAG: hypothetical protein WC490_01445 [Candidatus Margulisiibacteriota bacterium]
MLGQDKQIIRNQVAGWKKKGLLVQLKKGLYVFSRDYKPFPEPGSIANLLVQPSYLSLEYALSYYGLIPDIVRVYTSVSTKKTNRFENRTGIYHYRHIKNNFFFGYVKENGIMIATPEKALLDHVYLNVKSAGAMGEDFFAGNMRLQNIEGLKLSVLKKYARFFGLRKVDIAVKILEKTWKNY